MRILVTGGSGFIGTNLMDSLIVHETHTVINIDNNKPKVPSHKVVWKQCNILDKKEVDDIFSSFKPELVIHLAARTDTDPDTKLDDYKINTSGSENIINAIKASGSVKRVIFTSTQFVNQYHGIPKHDEDYAPHTVYGESKVIMEKMIRGADLKCEWVIIRPTNIWGPWHIRYPYEFWKVLSKGLYFHPGRAPVIRSYGYVGNVVSQIMGLIDAPREKINGKVFYVGDKPIDIYYWVNGFSVKQIGKNVIVIPRMLVKTLAIAGDILALVKLKFPITSSRYKSMTNSNTAPMEKTFEVLGEPPYSLEQGIDETVAWMKQYFPDLVKKH
jgi:nucleoside-diphosphate-sugar epimerase